MSVIANAIIQSLLRSKSQTSESTVSQHPVPVDDSLEPLPTVGFRAVFQPCSNRLQVTVLGARHLPAKLLGLVAEGYVVKVKVFPGSSKFETQQQPESWPTYNETFCFTLAATSKDPCSALIASRFIMLSVYAVNSQKKKKVVGALTWPLERSHFAGGNGTSLETGDIWRRLQDIYSAPSVNTPAKKDVRWNRMEVTLRYTTGDATSGEGDSLFIAVNRLRWSLDLTREYEEKKALLYIKLSLLEIGGSCIRSRNTRPFKPSISVHLTPENDKSVLEIPLPPPGQRRDGLTCQFGLCTRPSKIAKKLVLGRIRFGTTESVEGEDEPTLSHLGKALQAPGEDITEWHNLL